MKSGAALPVGVYTMPDAVSSAYDVHDAPPTFGKRSVPSGHVFAASPFSGTSSKLQTRPPLFASKAISRPFTAKLSPPAFPMNTIPFHAIGAAGNVSPVDGSPATALQSSSPVYG